MDTPNTAVAEVPSMKLAKVGKDRERRRGGLGWLTGRNGGSLFSGATGGAGAGAGGAAGVFGTSMSLAKLLTVLLVTAGVSVSAWMAGTVMSANPAGGKPAQKKLFADDKTAKYADTSGVIKSENSIPNSLGYISGSLDGMTPEERAKKAADAAAAAKAAEDAQKKADEDAKKKADEDAAKTPTSGDPAALAAAAAGAGAGAANGKKGLTAGRFGSGFGGSGGGGLAGGGGLSGGIGSNFGAMNNMNKGKAGAMSGFKAPAKPSITAASRAPIPKNNLKGFAKQQLGDAAAASRQAAASQSEAASAGAGAPFDGGLPAGSAIGGGPSSPGTAGAGGGGSTNPGGGGPVNSGTGSQGPCASGEELNINNVCQPIATPHVQNSAPYQWMYDLAKILLGVIAILSLVLLYISHAIEVALAAEPVGWAAVLELVENYNMVVKAIGAMGVMIGLLGVAIMAQTGDILQGAILTGIGAFIGCMCFIPGALDSVTIPEMAVAGLVLSAGGYLAAASKSGAALQ